MNFNKAEFTASYGISSQLAADGLPEIAFAGRSNVGKSSLLNKLFNRKNLARVSSVPGKTVTVNFYNVDGNRFVDLPGYGYASTGKNMRDQLKKMIESYILEREQLVNLFVLIDSRHEPQQIDLEFMEWLGISGIPFSIVFTKMDKQSATRGKENIESYKAKLLETWENLPPVFLTSSESKLGREELLGYINRLNIDLFD